jgi:HAMP domain-containing protein/PAS domain-containing protein
MRNLLNKLAVRFKLLSSFLLLAIFILILGLTAIFIQQSIKKNQKETLASINLSDAFFEGKYFLRADMHIYTELEKTYDKNRLDYWWGEHEFQIQFFNDQLEKVEVEFLINKSFDTDSLQTELIAITTAIAYDYDKKLLPVFNQFKILKNQEIQLLNDLNNPKIDSVKRVRIKQQINLLTEKYEGLDQEVTEFGLGIITKLDRGKDLVRLVIIDIEEKGLQLLTSSFIIFLIFTIVGVLFSIFIALYISKLITRPVNKILHHVDLLGKGEQPKPLNILMEDEFGAIQESLNTLTESLIRTSEFSKEIGEGNFVSDFITMGAKDILGNSLLHMRDSLNNARTEENKRRLEDERRSWAANGIGKFADIMRQSGESLNNLGYNLISSLIDYVGAVQGALFTINDEDQDDVHYELISAIAYDRNKRMQKKIKIGEGLVGRVIFEEKTIYLKEIPEDYVKITSGLGDSNPTTLLLVPIKLENTVNGVIELISFKPFEPYQIDFIEKVGENIASFVSSIKINEKTANLLGESQHKSEELAAQEEEMRQNMEELQATQEEAARREEERIQLWESLGEFIGIIETDLTGSILNANVKVSSILGMGIGELSTLNYRSVFFGNNEEKITELWNKVTSGIPVKTESVYQTSTKEINLSHELAFVGSDNDAGAKILVLIR